MTYILHTQIIKMIKKNTEGTRVIFCYDIDEKKNNCFLARATVCVEFEFSPCLPGFSFHIPNLCM